MRKIDKTCNLSTVYKAWEEDLTIPHPIYNNNSARTQRYKDVVTQLLYCQDGLCAFTEQIICDKSCYEEDKWTDGQYAPDKPEFEGELDHFDSDRKTNEGWAWDNFLVVSTHINQKRKGSKPVDDILKPDHPDYNENKVLAYNLDTNRFLPNLNLTTAEQERVQNMIEVLGLNFGSIVRKRREYLSDRFTLMEYEDDVAINQFPTAFKMSRQLRDNNEQNSFLDSFS